PRCGRSTRVQPVGLEQVGDDCPRVACERQQAGGAEASAEPPRLGGQRRPPRSDILWDRVTSDGVVAPGEAVADVADGSGLAGAVDCKPASGREALLRIVVHIGEGVGVGYRLADAAQIVDLDIDAATVVRRRNCDDLIVGYDLKSSRVNRVIVLRVGAKI